MVLVWVTTQFEGFHRYLDAPEDVAFLRSYHRHLFFVKLAVRVAELNREIEFFQLKRKLREYIATKYEGQQFEMSCEMIAADLLAKFEAYSVEVSEDGENGGTVYAEVLI